MDYSETLIRMREEIAAAQKGFLSKRFTHAESAAIELLRLSCKLLDEAEAAIASRLKESADRRKVA